MWRREKRLDQGASQESEGGLGKTFQAEDTEKSEVIDGKGAVGQGLTNCHKNLAFSIKWGHWRDPIPHDPCCWMERGWQRREGAAAIIQGQRDNGLAPGWHAVVTSDQVLDRFGFATT